MCFWCVSSYPFSPYLIGIVHNPIFAGVHPLFPHVFSSPVSQWCRNGGSGVCSMSDHIAHVLSSSASIVIRSVVQLFMIFIMSCMRFSAIPFMLIALWYVCYMFRFSPLTTAIAIRMGLDLKSCIFVNLILLCAVGDQLHFAQTVSSQCVVFIACRREYVFAGGQLC